MAAEFSIVHSTCPRDISDCSKKFPAARVLVVDDERLVRWAVAETLGDRGYEVSEAIDGESAKHAILAPLAAPHLVLLDLRLPDSDDLCLVSFIRRHAPETPIVLMTAYGSREIVNEAENLGVVVIAKPFDMNDLMSIIEHALARRPA